MGNKDNARRTDTGAADDGTFQDERQVSLWEEPDMIGKLIGVISIGGAGALIVVMGWLIWRKEKLSLLHDYHVNKVSTENKPAFCKLTGIGLIVIGAGLLISAIIIGMTDSPYSFLCFAVCFAVGLVMIITAGAKYNR